MSAHFSKFMLNTYSATPYFRAHVPDEYPLSLVLQKCWAFRRLPPNLKELSRRAKAWAIRTYPDASRDIEEWYDAEGYELWPGTGIRLTDEEIDSQWNPDGYPHEFVVSDIPIPHGGFADPETWEEPEKEEDPVDPDDIPSPAQLASDVASRGLARTADEYGMNADRLRAYLNLPDPLTQNDIPYDEAKSQFSERAALMLASPYFKGRNHERVFMLEALKGADIYDDLRGPAKLSFDLAEVHSLRFPVQEPAAETTELLVKAKESRKSCSKNSSPNTADEKVQPEHVAPGADYIQFYTLESYLFNTVHRRFAQQGYLGAFDFFCIVIWKANRAKTRVAKRLLGNTLKSLDEVVTELTKKIATQATPKDRMRLLMYGNIRFRLPMASAILTVLYPEEFTVYDYRVCETLGGFRNLTNLTNIDKLWEGYSVFKSAVISNSPPGLSLRDRDRYLWGKSFCGQLTTDIATGFQSASDDDGMTSAGAVE